MCSMFSMIIFRYLNPSEYYFIGKQKNFIKNVEKYKKVIIN